MSLGGTVAEAKQRLSYAEALQWFEYRQKHGSFGEPRTAYLLGQIAVMLNRAHGGKANLHDFLPGIPEPVIEDAAQFMQHFYEQ